MADGFTVTLVPSGRSFEVGPDETVLNAALRQGVALRYGCRQGRCSSCKYFLREGEVDFGKASPYSLSESEREDGYALLCCALPYEDLEIEEPEEADERALPVLTPSARSGVVERVEERTPSLWSLELALDEPLPFYPGQYVELALGDDPEGWRPYSMASSCERPDRLAFVLKRIPDGAFSGRLDRMASGDPVRVRGPYGTSYLRGEDPALLVGTGSGIAPLLSMLRSEADRGSERALQLFYGARTREELVFFDEATALGAGLPGLVAHASLSQPGPSWEGPAERVTTTLQREIADASSYDAHLCGSAEMCDAVGRLLEAKGIGDGRIFFDRFLPAQTSAGPTG